jgi:Rv0078B-related antitoxin
MPNPSEGVPRRYVRTLSNQSAIARIEILDDAMVAVLRQKSEAERLAMTSELFRSAQQLLRAAVRGAQPAWSEEEVEREVARRIALDAD